MVVEAISALSTAMGITGKFVALVEAKNDAERKLALSDLRDQVMKAQTEAFQLHQENIRIKYEIEKLNEWDKIKSKYKLVKIDIGTFLYKYIPNGYKIPEHYICPRCYEERERSIIQESELIGQCPRCSTAYTLKRPNMNLTSPDGWT